MLCEECGSEKFSVVRVWRNRKHSDKGAPVFNSLYDMRRVICNGCGKLYRIQAEMLFAEEYDKKTMKIKRVSPQEIKRRIERDDQLF